MGEGLEAIRRAAGGADGARAGDARALRALLRGHGDRRRSGPSPRRRSGTPRNQAQFLDRGARALRAGGRGAARAGRGALRLSGRGQLDDALPTGVVLDLGGGSMQLTRVEAREAVDARSWPLGAVRMTERFVPGEEEAQTERRCASTSRRSSRARRGSATAAGSWRRRHGPQPGRGGATRRGPALLRHPGLPGHARRRSAS